MSKQDGGTSAAISDSVRLHASNAFANSGAGAGLPASDEGFQKKIVENGIFKDVQVQSLPVAFVNTSEGIGKVLETIQSPLNVNMADFADRVAPVQIPRQFQSYIQFSGNLKLENATDFNANLNIGDVNATSPSKAARQQGQ